MVSAGVTTSSSVQVLRDSGLGLTGIGWVGEYHSPGTSAEATGLSSTPNTGFPVMRSRMYIRAVLPVSARAGTVFPLTLMSISVGGAGRSESHRSWWMVWNHHFSLPVSASTATTELPNRLAPGRSPP